MQLLSREDFQTLLLRDWTKPAARVSFAPRTEKSGFARDLGVAASTVPDISRTAPDVSDMTSFELK